MPKLASVFFGKLQQIFLTPNQTGILLAFSAGVSTFHRKVVPIEPSSSQKHTHTHESDK